MTQEICWFDGKWDSINKLSIPIGDRGLNFADGIFETILIFQGEPQLLSEHLSRWEQTASSLGMASPPPATWLEPLIIECLH